MIGGDILSAGAAGLAAVAGFALAAAMFGVRLLKHGRGPADVQLLYDGAVLVVSDGTIQQAAPAAATLLGKCVGAPLRSVLEDFLGAGAPPAIVAVERLEATGEPVELLVRTEAGAAYELIGAPAGALIRIILREASFLDAKLRDAETRLRAAEETLRAQACETQALHALVEEAPIIAWRRSGDGAVDWSAGRIRTRGGAVTPEQAVDLIMARARLNRQPTLAAEPQKFRIEIATGDSAESVALHVIELVRQDGSRIGFATDAGMAATAERTLARFVQTMTETFAHLTVGLAIFDRNQTLALFNPALVQMWQVEPGWLARRPSLREILDELRAIRRLPELEDFHQWRARLVGLFENTEAADYEELWHLADGSNIRVLARPHPHGALAFTFDDVSERMRLEQRYRHSIDLRRATLDGLAEGIAVFGSNGLLQFVNQAFHEIWGTDPDSVYAAMHARQLIELCEEMAAGPETWQKLHGFITGEEGRRAWSARLATTSGRVLTARFAPLPDGSTLAVFSDMTMVERVAGALAESEAALELVETARRAARDLASAAAPMLEEIEGRASELRHAPSSGNAADAAAVIERAVPALRGAIQSASEVAALPPPSGAGDRPAELPEALRTAAALVAPGAADAEIRVSADPSGAPERVPVPAGQLARIALQLTQDALACCERGGAVVLRAEATADGFALHADCSVYRPAPEDATEDGRLEYLAARQAGRVVFQGEPGGPARLSCLFQARLSGFGQPARPARPDAVRQLRPRAG